MARVAEGFRYAEYLASVARSGGDVERLPPRAMKSYLQRRLRVVEAQIELLAQQLDAGALQRGSWAQTSLDDERWTSLASLNYLFAARDALLRTIATL
jgi:hypothetical protein